MKIALLGIKTSVMDEGAKNVATYLSAALAKNHEVLVCHQREALSLKFVRKLAEFRPDIILSVHGPSPKTVALLFILRLFSRGSRSVVIATQPSESRWLGLTLKLLSPDLVFSQSDHWNRFFLDAGLACELLPNGVDTEKFRPVEDSAALDTMRGKLGLNTGQPVALHIGPVNHNRNLELLVELHKRTGWQVLVIGSTTAPFLSGIYEHLESNGILVRNEYFPDINLVYALADVYIFPVMDKSGSIEVPLTVLEAMSCNRPVASFPFRGLPDFIRESAGMRYFNSLDELVSLLPDLRGKNGNREAILQYGWSRIAEMFTLSIKEHFRIT